MKLIDSLRGSIKKLGKEQFIIFVLAGALLLIISFPTDSAQDTELNPESEHNSFFKSVNETGTNLGMVAGRESDAERQGEMNQESLEAVAGSEEEYVRNLEHRLKELLGYCNGCGEVEVMITLRSKLEKVVEKDRHIINVQTTEEDGTGGLRKQIESDHSEASIYTGSQSGTQIPLVVEEKLPQIEGVVIIAKGGDDPVVKSNITQAVQALFSIEAHKIKIIKMK